MSESKLLKQAMQLEQRGLALIERAATGSSTIPNVEDLDKEQRDRKKADKAFREGITKLVNKDFSNENVAAPLALFQEEMRVIRDYNICKTSRKRLLFAQYALLHNRVKQIDYEVNRKPVANA